MGRREWPHPRLAPSPGFSRALEAPSGRTIYFSGQVPTDERGETVGEGDMGAQASACFEKIQEMLAAAGGSMDDVVKVTLFVTDMGGMDAVRAVRERFFTREPYPAMTGVEVTRLAHPAWLIEVEAVAVVP